MAKKDATAVASPNVRYHRMTKVDDGFIDLQFQKPKAKIPWRALILAIGLFTMGSLLIVIASLLMAGYIDAMYGDRTWPLLILGSLMFIPGAYHVRIAYYAFRGYHGYTFDDFPDFD